jgi:hypothetical protein
VRVWNSGFSPPRSLGSHSLGDQLRSDHDDAG